MLAGTEAHDAVLVIAERALVVIRGLRESADLDGVWSPHLGQRIAELRSFLLHRVLAYRVLEDRGLREVRDVSVAVVSRNVRGRSVEHLAVGRRVPERSSERRGRVRSCERVAAERPRR